MQQPGGSAAAGAASQPARPPDMALQPPVDPGPVFVSYDERKETSERKPARKSGGHTYVVKFFLVDSHGREYLAATGEDQGDAHYLYENQTSFPFLRANNKADVRVWMEGIIERSKERAGVHSHLVTDAVPADPNQIQLPKFVGHSQEKLELPDGRHRIEWYLMDERNDAHLAIVGEEKETRDGHYLYRTQGVFDKALPLQVGNQREVERWIDVMVFHAGQVPLGAGGKSFGAADSQGGSGRAHSALMSDNSAQRGGASSRGGHGARPSGGQQKAGQKHDLLRQATSNVKKLKFQGGRGADPDQEAPDVVATELQRWAQEEALRRDGAKRQALAYATDPLAGKEAAAVKRCLAVLKQAATTPAFLPPPPRTGRGAASGSGTHQQQLNLVDTLAALRELAHMYAPLSLVAMPDLKECLGKLKGHQHPEVQLLAASVLEQWLHTAVAQVQVLNDPRYAQDPRSVLDSRLASREIMDPIVAAVTHRKMHPPPPPQPPQPLYGQYPGQLDRAGSRLGPAAGVMAAAAAAAGGISGQEATPGGLVGRPSEQSLQGLASMRPPGAGGSAFDSAAAMAQQTAERRRLNLDAADSPGGGGVAGMLTSAGMRRQQQQLAATATSSGIGEEDEEEGGEEGPTGMRLDSDSRQRQGSGRQGSGRPGSGAGGSGEPGLSYAASVELINAPIEDMESEQAELL